MRIRGVWMYKVRMCNNQPKRHEWGRCCLYGAKQTLCVEQCWLLLASRGECTSRLFVQLQLPLMSSAVETRHTVHPAALYLSSLKGPIISEGLLIVWGCQRHLSLSVQLTQQMKLSSSPWLEDRTRGFGGDTTQKEEDGWVSFYTSTTQSSCSYSPSRLLSPLRLREIQNTY